MKRTVSTLKVRVRLSNPDHILGASEASEARRVHERSDVWTAETHTTKRAKRTKSELGVP